MMMRRECFNDLYMLVFITRFKLPGFYMNNKPGDTCKIPMSISKNRSH